MMQGLKAMILIMSPDPHHQLEAAGTLMNKSYNFDNWKRLAKVLAVQYGSMCEVVLHDLTGKDPSHTIIAIQNGQISGRKVGDGSAAIVAEAMEEPEVRHEDRLAYLTRTRDGKILKSSSLFIRDDDGLLVGILSINTDISLTLAVENALHSFNSSMDKESEPTEITTNVSDLLDTLIEQSIRMIGKPAALMGKDEKVRAIRFLNDSGAFLITKSGPRVCQVFNISKYTLYSYLDEAKSLS